MAQIALQTTTSAPLDLLARSRVGSAITVDVPEWFQDAEFVEWLNSDLDKFTWHKKGQPVTEWSDAVVLIDPSLNGEGSEDAGASFPEKYWEQLVQLCRDSGLGGGDTHIHVRLTNLGEPG